MNLKKLSPRERLLAVMSAGTIFVVLNFLFLPKLTAANRAAHAKHADLKARLTAAEAWVSQKEYWQERRDWLEKNEPVLNAAREDSATQLEELQREARKHNLRLADVQFLQLPATEFYQPIGVRFTISGLWAGVVEFVADLQDPKLFDVIPRFSVKSEEEPPNVRCELEVQRWFYQGPDDANE